MTLFTLFAVCMLAGPLCVIPGICRQLSALSARQRFVLSGVSK